MRCTPTCVRVTTPPRTMDPLTIGIVKAIDAVFFARKRKQKAEQRKQEAARAAQEAARADAAYRAQRCCTSCSSEVAIDAAFCQRCGGNAFTTRETLLAKAAEEQKRKNAIDEQRKATERANKEAERRERARRDAARTRCREFASFRYCAACRITLEATYSFCTTCGAGTDSLPIRYAVQYAADEFPDLVSNETDFNRLVK